MKSLGRICLAVDVFLVFILISLFVVNSDLVLLGSSGIYQSYFMIGAIVALITSSVVIVRAIFVNTTGMAIMLMLPSAFVAFVASVFIMWNANVIVSAITFLTAIWIYFYISNREDAVRMRLSERMGAIK